MGTLPPAPCLPAPLCPTSRPTQVAIAALPLLRAAWPLCDTVPDAEVVAPGQHQSRQQSSIVARGPGQEDRAKEALYTKVSGSSAGQAQHRVRPYGFLCPAQPTTTAGITSPSVLYPRLQNSPTLLWGESTWGISTPRCLMEKTGQLPAPDGRQVEHPPKTQLVAQE